MSKKSPAKKDAKNTPKEKDSSTARDRNRRPVKAALALDAYRITLTGPLKNGLVELFQIAQRSRKYRRVASGSIHELAKEALDLGMQRMEEEIRDEISDLGE